jgi:hypothetical protein
VDIINGELAGARIAQPIQATDYGLNDQEVGVRVPVGSRIFSFPLFRPALGPTQRPIEWVLGALYRG